MLLAAGRCLFRAGGLFCFGKLLADGSAGLADALVPVFVFANQRIDAIDVDVAKGLAEQAERFKQEGSQLYKKV